MIEINEIIFNGTDAAALPQTGEQIAGAMDNVTQLKHSSDTAIRYVRVTDRDRHGNVEFQFSIGDPSLYLEMILPAAAFGEFCREHCARVLSQQESDQVDANDARWRFGDDQQE